MKATLYLIVDVSGSMNEMGKIHLQRNLCRYAAQVKLMENEKYANVNIQFYQWAQNISEIVIQGNGDIPVLNAQGSSGLPLLLDFFSENLKDADRSKVLVLSDGFFSSLEIENFQNQLGKLAKLIIRTVAVGADADLLKLKKISTNNTVYLAENIASAIDSVIFGSDEIVAEPTTISQIPQSESVESDDSEEDWDA